MAAEVDLAEAEPELAETGVEDAPETEARVEELLAVDLTDDAEEERVEEPLAVDLTEDEEEERVMEVDLELELL